MNISFYYRERSVEENTLLLFQRGEILLASMKPSADCDLEQMRDYLDEYDKFHKRFDAFKQTAW